MGRQARALQGRASRRLGRLRRVAIEAARPTYDPEQLAVRGNELPAFQTRTCAHCGRQTTFALQDRAGQLNDLFLLWGMGADATRTWFDVEVGVLLSGGIDSSTIVGYMSQNMPEPVQTFSIGFNESRFDERPYAARVARTFGTVHRMYTRCFAEVGSSPSRSAPLQRSSAVRPLPSGRR